MQMFYGIPLFLIGSGLVIFGLVKTIQLWPHDFFISESERTRRSALIGISGAIFVFGIFQLLFLFIDEDVTFSLLMTTLCFFGVTSIFVGIVGGISTYRWLWSITKSTDDIGTIRDK
jgi:formate hydrogenlyase subunit 3/multisubunit Na+/H+ antiporter MnhD subunit